MDDMREHMQQSHSMYQPPAPLKKRFKNVDEYFKKVVSELFLTLSSRAQPYYDVSELARQFFDDSGMSPLEIAVDFGFPTFEQFLRDDMMSKHVKIEVDRGGNLMYMPHENDKTKHLRDSQIASYNVVTEKDEKAGERKLDKAYYPENRANLMKGKRRLVRIVNSLGGLKKPVAFQDVQKVYLEKFGVTLANEEMKRLFQRRNPEKILLKLFHDEFELHQAVQCPGMIFIKLKKSKDGMMFKEIQELFAEFEEFEKQQAECENRIKQNSYPHLPERLRKIPKTFLDLNCVRPNLPPITMNDSKYASNAFDQNSDEVRNDRIAKWLDSSNKSKSQMKEKKRSAGAKKLDDSNVEHVFGLRCQDVGFSSSKFVMTEDRTLKRLDSVKSSQSRSMEKKKKTDDTKVLGWYNAKVP